MAIPGNINLPRFSIPLPNAMLSEMQNKVEKEIKQIMGMDINAVLPEGIKKSLADAVKVASDQQLTAQISRISAKHASQILGKEIQIDQAIKSKLQVGLEGIKAVGASSEYTNILKENARMVKAKYDAMVEVGFTPDQAFKLIEAEIHAKSTNKGGR